jgi:hypothetical protein
MKYSSDKRPSKTRRFGVDTNVDNDKYCYDCERKVKWLAPDGRCGSCTICTPEEIAGGAL